MKIRPNFRIAKDPGHPGRFCVHSDSPAAEVSGGVPIAGLDDKGADLYAAQRRRMGCVVVDERKANG